MKDVSAKPSCTITLALFSLPYGVEVAVAAATQRCCSAPPGRIYGHGEVRLHALSILAEFGVPKRLVRTEIAALSRHYSPPTPPWLSCYLQPKPPRSSRSTGSTRPHPCAPTRAAARLAFLPRLRFHLSNLAPRRPLAWNRRSSLAPASALAPPRRTRTAALSATSRVTSCLGCCNA